MASSSNFSSPLPYHYQVPFPRHLDPSHLYKEVLDIPEFDGRLHPKDFADWLHRIEQILSHRDIFESHRVRFVAKKLKGYAFIWWENLKKQRKLEGRTKIVTWSKMKRELLRRFLPSNYAQDSYLQSHKQASSVNLWDNDDLLVTKGEEEIPLNDDDPTFDGEEEIIVCADEGDMLEDDILPSDENEIENEIITVENEKVMEEAREEVVNMLENKDEQVVEEEAVKLILLELTTLPLIPTDQSIVLPLNDNGSTFSEEKEITPIHQGDVLVLPQINLSIIHEDEWQQKNISHTEYISHDKMSNVVTNIGSFKNVVPNKMEDTLELKTVIHPQPYEIPWLRRDKRIKESSSIARTNYGRKWKKKFKVFVLLLYEVNIFW